jgi:hypothetical protein
MASGRTGTTLDPQQLMTSKALSVRLAMIEHIDELTRINLIKPTRIELPAVEKVASMVIIAIL